MNARMQENASLAQRNPVGPTPTGIAAPAHCRLCDCILDQARGDNVSTAVCAECRHHPHSRRLGSVARAGATGAVGVRDFTPAEKSLISKMHAIVPPQQLLALLNERLAGDLGHAAKPYTVEQLQAEIGTRNLEGPTGGDWGSVRKVLANARRSGVLASINAQVIDDFAIVFSLSPAQVVRLKDVVLPALEGSRS